MRSVEHKSSRLWRSFTAFSGRFAVISVVCAGLLTAGGYAYMVPRLGGELASAGALPVPSPASSKEAALSPLPLDLDAKRQAPAEADGSLEIAEVTGQDDTLYSLLSADVNDEPTVVAICRTIGPVIE